MNEAYIIGLAVTAVLGLIGLLYKIMSKNVADNTSDIKNAKEAIDSRCDEIEKDIVHIKTKIE